MFGSTEGLLEKTCRAAVGVRKEVRANGHEPVLQCVKSMYSKFVSTTGKSSAHREFRRPEWMRIIRSRGRANLWRKTYKAYKAYQVRKVHTAGLTVADMPGTDKLHPSEGWYQAFTEVGDLSRVRARHMCMFGSGR